MGGTGDLYPTKAATAEDRHLTSDTWQPDLKALSEVAHAPRTDAICNCQLCLTKIPIDAIRPFIESFRARARRSSISLWAPA